MREKLEDHAILVAADIRSADQDWLKALDAITDLGSKYDNNMYEVQKAEQKLKDLKVLKTKN